MGYMFIGVLLGSSCFNLVTLRMSENLGVISNLALALIGFTIGGELKFSEIRELGTSILSITVFEALAASLLVLFSVFLLTKSWPIALIFGAIASATAPAATVSVLWQYHAEGSLTTTLFAVVGLDDAAALMTYAFTSSVAKALIVGTKNLLALSLMDRPLLEILGSLLVGVTIGIVLNYVATKIREQYEFLIICLGAIMLCAGLALRFHFSLILTNMALGITFINLSTKNRVAFDAMRNITPPIYLLFFVLVGVKLQLGLLPKLGLLGLIYILMRALGKSLGAYFGAAITDAPETVRKYVGLGLLPSGGCGHRSGHRCLPYL